MSIERLWKRGLIAVVLFAALAVPAGAATYLGFSIGVSNAPPPPRVIITSRPEFYAVPGTRVYVVENTDYDLFRYGGTYYIYNDGYWYRSSRSSGPYVVVDVRSVPVQILRVPSERWKHHPHGGPPGQMRAPGERGRGHGRH
jgi:hypothetical protein